MNSSDLPKPWQYKNKWVIWPETVIDAISISNCKDTIKGICEIRKSVKDCIDNCDVSCALGYHIEFENGKTICACIRTDIYPYLNPIHRLKRKELYPELSNVKISTFINTDVFPFPPEEANVVFFKDILNISEVANGSVVKAGSKGNLPEQQNFVYVGNDSNHNLQFLQAVISSEQIAKYIPVHYGSPIQISTPGTSLLLSVTYENKLLWKSISRVIYTKETTFKLLPLTPVKKIGDDVTYGDIFAITYGDGSSFVVVDQDHLTLVSDNIGNILNNKKLICKFSLKSKMTGYYCDGRDCKPVDIKDMEISGQMGRYKGVTVGRDPNCWGVCKYLKLGTNSTMPLSSIEPSSKKTYSYTYIVILSMIFIFILSIIILFLIKSIISFSDVLSPPPYFAYAF
jgi:hypothetical protein